MTDDRWIIDSDLSTRLPVYTRLNANDVMADPITPLGADLCWVPQIFTGWSSSYVINGTYTVPEMFDEPGTTCAFIYGYLYVNQSAVRVIGIRSGIGWEAIDSAFFADPNQPPHVAHRASPTDVNEANSARIAELTGAALAATSNPELDEDRETALRMRASRPDLATASSDVLVAWARAVMPIERQVWRSYSPASSRAALGPGIMGSVLGAEGAHLMLRLLKHGGDVDSALPSYALWDLSRIVRADSALTAEFDRGVDGLLARLTADHPEFAARFRGFIAEYGYRGPSEWDLGCDSWETRPELTLVLIERLRTLGEESSPDARQQHQAADQALALTEALELLGDNAEAVATLQMAMSAAQRYGGWRERGKSTAVMVINEARVALFEFGRRLVAGGHLDDPHQVFQALDSELDALLLDPASVRDRILEREQQWRALFDVEPPLYVLSSEPFTPFSELIRRDADDGLEAARPGDVLTGAGASAGVARGRVRLVTDLMDADEFEPGEVLLAPQTDPSWTPLFMVAAAVVVDVGSMGSHAMIVSRELGIPCAAGVTGATKRIPNGALVEVDGSTGRVTVLEL